MVNSGFLDRLFCDVQSSFRVVPERRFLLNDELLLLPQKSIGTSRLASLLAAALTSLVIANELPPESHICQDVLNLQQPQVGHIGGEDMGTFQGADFDVEGSQ